MIFVTERRSVQLQICNWLVSCALNNLRFKETNLCNLATFVVSKPYWVRCCRYSRPFMLHAWTSFRNHTAKLFFPTEVRFNKVLLGFLFEIGARKNASQRFATLRHFEACRLVFLNGLTPNARSWSMIRKWVGTSLVEFNTLFDSFIHFHRFLRYQHTWKILYDSRYKSKKNFSMSNFSDWYPETLLKYYYKHMLLSVST